MDHFEGKVVKVEKFYIHFEDGKGNKFILAKGQLANHQKTQLPYMTLGTKLSFDYDIDCPIVSSSQFIKIQGIVSFN